MILVSQCLSGACADETYSSAKQSERTTAQLEHGAGMAWPEDDGNRACAGGVGSCSAQRSASHSALYPVSSSLMVSCYSTVLNNGREIDDQVCFTV